MSSGPAKGKADYLALGDWNAQCFECGRKFKASTLRLRWEGYRVCENCWEPRQPQDYVKGVPDHPQAPWAQPMPADTFAAFCTPNGQSAVPDYGMPDCMVPDALNVAFNPEGDPL